MSTATDSQLDVEITVTETAPCTKQIKLRVPAAAVDGRLEAAFGSFAMAAAMPGFRKGKAPRNLLEKKFGKAMLDDLKFELLNRSFEEAKEASADDINNDNIDDDPADSSPSTATMFMIARNIRSTIMAPDARSTKAGSPRCVQL